MSKIIVSYLAVHILSSPTYTYIIFFLFSEWPPFFSGYAFLFYYIKMTIFYNDILTRKVDFTGLFSSSELYYYERKSTFDSRNIRVGRNFFFTRILIENKRFSSSFSSSIRVEKKGFLFIFLYKMTSQVFENNVLPSTSGRFHTTKKILLH